jgi:hypothetical protein
MRRGFIKIKTWWRSGGKTYPNLTKLRDSQQWPQNNNFASWNHVLRRERELLPEDEVQRPPLFRSKRPLGRLERKNWGLWAPIFCSGVFFLSSLYFPGSKFLRRA